MQHISQIISVTQANDWDDPVSLTDYKLPEFPVDALPKILADFCRQLSDFTETPYELAALLELAVVSTCVAKTYEIEVKPGYLEPINIWVCPSLSSSNRKTAVLGECTAPLLQWQRDQEMILGPRLRELESRRKSEEAVVQSLRTKLGKIDQTEKREKLIQEILVYESKLTQVPKLPQLWSSDLTPEKLGMLMAENNERIALISDEGGIFDLISGRYSGGIPNLDLILKAHAGSSDRVDRAGRASIYLSKPSLTFGISPQPSVLQAFSAIPTFRGRGLLARFLYACPSTFVGHRTFNGSPITESCRNSYRTLIKSLLQNSFNLDGYTLTPPRILKLSRQSLDLWHQFALELEPRLKEDADLHSISDWTGKLPGAAIRLAGLLHVSEHIGQEPERIPIEATTMFSALKISSVLISHAQLVFGLMGADPDLENAKYVLRWILREKPSLFKRSEAHNTLQKRFPKVDVLTRALQILAERNYIRGLPKETVCHRPSTKYLVNPKLKLAL